MPCKSDYMEPTVKERQHRQAAQLLVYVHGKLGQPVPKKLSAAAADIYGGADGEKNMEFLCTLIRNMSEEQRERIVYNGRDPMARRLADWWDEHEAEDAKRLEIERGVLKTAKGAKAFFDSNNKRDFDLNLREFSKLSGLWYDPEESVSWFDLTDGVLIVSRMNGVEAWQGKKL